MSAFLSQLCFKGSNCTIRGCPRIGWVEQVGTTKKKKKKHRKPATWRRFSLKELQTATNNFDYDNKIGEGGFGSVYWGQLMDGSQVAVKRLKTWSSKADLEFAVEVEILARVRHKNLLTMRGYCAEGQERLIVYDFMPNLSLYSHLRGPHSGDAHLHWSRRMRIAVGSAEGIAYLHHHAAPHIIHRDIKANNVLLNSEFDALVADFGFARLLPEGVTHVTTRVKGTLGYIAPEYAMFGKASEGCDVYSFGVLLLELASGRKPIEKVVVAGSAAVEKVAAGVVTTTTRRTIIDWAAPLAREGRFQEVADPRLEGDFVREEMERLVLVALACTRSCPAERPAMLDVVEFLRGECKEKLQGLLDEQH